MSSTVRPLVMGSIAFVVSLSLYSLSVILTTPNLSPIQALETALKLNGFVMIAVSLGIGVQVSLTSYAKSLPCRIKMAGTTSTTTSSSALSAFFSFFSLVQVGCCGTWLYILSLLPGLLGVGMSGFIIQFSKILTTFGLFAIAVSITYSLRSVLKARSRLKRDNQIQLKVVQNSSNHRRRSR